MAEETPRPRRSSRRRARHRRLALSWTIAGAAAVLAIFADGAPTGLGGVDAGYQAAYAVLVTMACAQARRWTWPIVAGGALLGGPTEWWSAVAAVALAVAVASQFDRRRRQPAGALVGALAAQALLRLPALVAFGVPSLVALLAPLPAIVVAARVLRRRSRRVIWRSMAGVAALVVVLALGFAAGTLLIRSDAQEGVAAARDGMRLLRNGDEVEATNRFAAARRAFEDANATANAWWMAPARLVPVVSQHVDAADVVTTQGAALAEASNEAAPAVALDELTRADGSFRLGRLEELRPMAEDVLATLRSSREQLELMSDDWLTDPMTSAVDDLRAEIDDALPEAELATEALEVAPGLLGADGPRNYLVVFANPAEARELGGFVAALGLLTVDDGDLRFESGENPAALERALTEAGAALDAEVPPTVQGANPARFVRNWTDSPSIDTVTAIAADLYPDATGGTEVHGVLYLDPYVLEALLEITGPVTIPNTDTELTEDDAADHLLRGQYLDEDFERGLERKDRLGDAGEEAFARLLEQLPPPRRLARVLSPLVQARRLLFATTDPEAHDLLREIGLRPALTSGADDDLLVAHGNRRPGKLDAYLERAIRYDVTVGAAGEVEATVTVELTNTAPRTGLSSYQTGVPSDPAVDPTTNQITLDVYSRLRVAGVLVDGDDRAINELPAYDLRRYSVPVAVPAGETVTVTVRLTGQVDPAGCAFAVTPNAGARTDEVTLSVTQGENRETLGEKELASKLRANCPGN